MTSFGKKKSRFSFLKNPYILVGIVVVVVAGLIVGYVFVDPVHVALEMIGAALKGFNLWLLDGSIGGVNYALIAYSGIVVFVFYLGMALKGGVVDWRLGISKEEQKKRQVERPMQIVEGVTQ